jgi:hypothetical protein
VVVEVGVLGELMLDRAGRDQLATSAELLERLSGLDQHLSTKR